MTIHPIYLKASLLASITLSTLLLSTQNSFAQDNDSWNYSCFDEKRTKILQFEKPNLFVWLDASGSMEASLSGRKISYNMRRKGVKSRMELAKEAFIDLAEANNKEPIVNYGFATFSQYLTNYQACSSYTPIHVIQTIQAIPQGPTYTHEAIKASSQISFNSRSLHSNSVHLAENTCLKNRKPNQTYATVVISDGQPSFPQLALKAACQHRSTAPIYFVGLAGAAGVGLPLDQMNNLLAAAGGTGQCTMGDPCEPNTLARLTSPMRRGLPHELLRHMATCSGAFSADDPKQLVDVIQDITRKLACTFPLETNPNDPVAIPSDPTNEYPYIKLRPAILKTTGQPIPYRYSSAGKKLKPSETWTFANDQRTAVQLGSAACEDIRKPVNNVSYEEMITHVGCICKKTPGSSCTSNDPDGICPPVNGTWICDRGLDICQTPPDITSSIPPRDCTILGATGHCKFGVADTCISGVPQCRPKSGPMPEYCNGIDDDCDGLVDNMTHSWENTFSTDLQSFKSSDPDAYENLERYACNTLNTCACEDGIAQQGMPDGYFSPASLASYSADAPNRKGSCECQTQ